MAITVSKSFHGSSLRIMHRAFGAGMGRGRGLSRGDLNPTYFRRSTHAGEPTHPTVLRNVQDMIEDAVWAENHKPTSGWILGAEIFNGVNAFFGTLNALLFDNRWAKVGWGAWAAFNAIVFVGAGFALKGSREKTEELIESAWEKISLRHGAEPARFLRIIFQEEGSPLNALVHTLNDAYYFRAKMDRAGIATEDHEDVARFLNWVPDGTAWVGQKIDMIPDHTLDRTWGEGMLRANIEDAMAKINERFKERLENV